MADEIVDDPDEPFVPVAFFEPYAQQEHPTLTAMTRESAIAAMVSGAKAQGFLLGPVEDMPPMPMLVKGEPVVMCAVKAQIVGAVAP